MFTTNPETEIEIERLEAALSNLPIREVITYSQLSEAVGYDVQDKPFALIKARQRVEEKTGMRLGTVRGEGIKKLDGEAIVGIGVAARKSIARRAKRQAARLTNLSYNDIDGKTQQRIDAERSLLGAISSAATANVSKIEPIAATGPAVSARVFEALNKL